LGGDEGGGGKNGEVEEESAGTDFVREVCCGRDCRDEDVVEGGEVSHAVLQVAHVAEEVFGRFGGRADGGGWSEGGARVSVF